MGLVEPGDMWMYHGEDPLAGSQICMHDVAVSDFQALHDI